MTNSALVTVVVLCYNHAPYVIECLDSVLAQQYKNWELIIADDASKDNSVEQIREWMLAHSTQILVRTNFHIKNTGIGTMLNECIGLANGRYLKFISADDVLHEALLKEAVDFFEQSDKDYGVIFSNAQYIKSDSSRQEKYLIPKNKKVPKGWIRPALQYSNFIPAPAVVIKKEVYQKIGFYDPQILIDDYDCWLRASIHYRFHYIDKPLVYYRIHDNNISHSIDFSNDMIALLIQHDKDGDLGKGINQKIKDHYYQGNTQLKVLEAYFKYPYRDRWMAFCISYKIPYKLFRLFDKINSIFNLPKHD